MTNPSEDWPIAAYMVGNRAFVKESPNLIAITNRILDQNSQILQINKEMLKEMRHNELMVHPSETRKEKT